MTTAKYGCSQAVFVVLVNTVLDSLEEYLLQFTAYSPRYIQAWIDDRRTELLTAEALPDEHERSASSEILRVTLAGQNTTCCGYWQRLKRYMSKAYPREVLAIQLYAAGQNYYRDATNESWPMTKKMLISAKNFMTTNLAALTANDNMPPNFPTEMNAAALSFNTTLPLYESSKESIFVATEAKIKAYNDIHDLITSMMLDGQDIFKNQEAIRTQFVYSNILARISGSGLAGIRGVVLNITDNQPIENVTVTITLDTEDEAATFYTVDTDAEGKYLINCPSGKYQLEYMATDFVSSPVKHINIVVGTVSTFNEKLAPVTVGELV